MTNLERTFRRAMDARLGLRRCLHCEADLVWNGEWSVWQCPNKHDDPEG